MSMLFTTSGGDSQDMPKPSLIQQFTSFERNGGSVEKFCMIAGIDNSQQLMYATAFKVANGISFRYQTIKKTPDAQGQIDEIQKRIAQTLSTLTGLKRVPDTIADTEENLGVSFVGNH